MALRSARGPALTNTANTRWVLLLEIAEYWEFAISALTSVPHKTVGWMPRATADEVVCVVADWLERIKATWPVRKELERITMGR